MVYKWTVHLWVNGAKSTNYTDYLIAPIFLEDRLNDELDTGEIILEGINKKEPFPPKTKFRIAKLNSNNVLLDEYHMIVDHDDVQEYPQCPGYYTHRIYLIEPSAVAQGMHVDNIALTYELRDIDLNYKTVDPIDDTSLAVSNIVNSSEYAGARMSGSLEGFFDYETETNTALFENTYKFEWEDTNKLYATYNSHVGKIKINIPRCKCFVYSGAKWEYAFDLSTVTTVYKKTWKNGKWTLSSERYYGGPNNYNEIIANASDYVKNNFSVFFAVEEDNSQIYSRIINGTGDEPFKHNDIYEQGAFCPFPPGSYNQTIGRVPKEVIKNRLWGHDEDSCLFRERSTVPSIELNIQPISAEELEDELYYEYTLKTEVCPLNPLINSKLLLSYKAKAVGIRGSSRDIDQLDIQQAESLYQKENIMVETTFLVSDLDGYESKDITLFQKPTVKYNLYDFFIKALRTVDTQFASNINDVIEVDAYWKGILQSTEIYETTVQAKNLWEVLLLIGNYIHAIPYLEFASGEDKYVLKFRQLGLQSEKDDNSVKLSVFTSRNLSEFFTQLDSYTNNLYSPQNVVTETIVPKTSDSTYLISNDTAELHLSKPIMELVSIKMKNEWAAQHGFNYYIDITNKVFESSVYSLLSVESPNKISPVKGNTLFFTYNTNKIQGLSYVPPSVNEGDHLAALKQICKEVYGLSFDVASNIKYNQTSFIVTYRTQDSLRVNKFRPDLDEFMKVSSYEKYPHHEQFYGQQEKIVDSEKYSLNLFGQLIRVGNNVYQCQEYAIPGNEKESGDLVLIGEDPYYVTQVENECYNDAIFQKVTYSKNFNQLAQIVTIPSEPRFYEIATQSLIRREIRMNDFFKLSAGSGTSGSAVFLGDDTWAEKLKAIMFGDAVHPNYAYTKFSDGDNKSTLFPSSVIVRTGENNVAPAESKKYSDCIVPVLRYPIKDGLVYEWDMQDNFSAGDYVDKNATFDEEDPAYYAMQPVRYVDVFGRADYFEFKLFSKGDVTYAEAQNLPRGDAFETLPTEYAKSPSKIVLNKDNREQLSFNYQLNLLYDPKSGFVTYPNLFGDNSHLRNSDSDTIEIKAYALTEKLNPMSSDLSVSFSSASTVSYSISAEDLLTIKFTSSILASTQSILFCVVVGTNKYPLIGRNVSGLPNKGESWIISSIFNKK